MVMDKDTIKYKIFDFIRQRRACTRQDIEKSLNIPSNSLTVYISLLLKQGLIFQGKPVQSKTRKCSRVKVIGITKEDIKRKEKELTSKVSEKDFLDGLYKKVFDIVQRLDCGVIPSEVILEIQVDKPDYMDCDYIGTVLRDLWKRKLLKRSPFRIPPEILGEDEMRGTYVYGLNDEIVKEKVLELAPAPVRDSYFRIVNEAKVFASFYLKELTGISVCKEDNNDKVPLVRQWLINRFFKAGWLNYRSHKQMGYFWRVGVPEELVISQIREIHPKAMEYRLEAQNLGRMSEKRALFVFVMYAKLVWGRQIDLPEGFPNNIPSWFDKSHIDKYTTREINKDGSSNVVLRCGVWRFDINPLDFVILEKRDDMLKSHPSGFALNCKFTTKKIGDIFLKQMLSDLKNGFIYKYRMHKELKKKVPKEVMIPQAGILKPVIFCKNTFGGIIWKIAGRTGSIVISFSKLKEMEEHLKERFGIEYIHSKEIDKMMEKVRLYEKYQQYALAHGEDAIKMVNEVVR